MMRGIVADNKGFAIPTVETGGLRSPLNPTICHANLKNSSFRLSASSFTITP